MIVFIEPRWVDVCRGCDKTGNKFVIIKHLTGQDAFCLECAGVIKQALNQIETK